jgi:membrane-associated phospholipid phosphatase
VSDQVRKRTRLPAKRIVVRLMARLCLLVLILAGAIGPSHPAWAAAPTPPSPQAPLLETKTGLLTATFSDRTDDAALRAALPALIAQGVQSINLRGAPVRDIRPLAGAITLKALDLRGTQVRDVTPLAALTGLQSLNLQFLRISDLQPLAGLHGLRSLNLCGTEVRDLTPLSGLAGLQELVVSVTRVKDLTPLAPLHQLTSLDVGSTWVDDIRPLSGMVILRFLSLNGTAVVDIQPLSHMQALQTLDLGGTPVSDVTPLAHLRNLRSLDLESTQVADVRPLASLTSLHALALGGSLVNDLSPLSNLSLAPALGAQPEPVAADPVVFWNDQTNWAIQVTRADAFQASRALALESIVVLDTIRSLNGEAGFLVRLPAPDDVPQDIAIAAAAHAMLSHLFPVRQAALDIVLASALAREPQGLPRRRASEFGRAVATAVIMMREHDGWNGAGTLRVGTAPGQWRPTPPGFLPPQDPQWATMKPFALITQSQFRPLGPPSLPSPTYQAARAKVVALGSATSTVRTTEQTEIAHYWSDAIGTYAPAGHWNAIAGSLIVPTHAGMAAEATMFAELNVAMADAAIAMADAKYSFWFWRPITAIRSGEDGLPQHPEWSSLLETPNHPSYISGHSTFSGAAAIVLAKWFGSRPFTFASASLPGVTRNFTSFDQAAEEAAMSRVYGGIHFPFDNVDGLATGRAIGGWTLAMFQRPAPDRGPFVMVDDPQDAGGQGPTRITGCALDNLAPLAAVQVRLDDGPPFSVAVDSRGLFSMPTPRASSPGQHRMVLTATSSGGHSTAVDLALVSDADGTTTMSPRGAH